MNVGRPVYTAITQKLTRALAPVSLVVVDESAAHAGHVGNPARGDPSAETHFKVEVVSDAFEGKRQVLRHRMIYDALREEIGAFVGVVVGAELRRLRAVGPAIAAVDWAAHDAPWQPPGAGGADA